MRSGPDELIRPIRFRDSWRNWTRITTVRIIVQAVFFGLFVAFVLLTTFKNLDRWPALRFWLNKFLEIDPLIALATAITTHSVYDGLLWSLLIVIPTLFLGRFFCGWICPYGTLHQFVRWLLRGPVGSRSTSGTRPLAVPGASAGELAQRDPNRYRASQQLKYYILVGLLVAAACGGLQIGLLDPLALLYRSLTGAALPALHMPPRLVGPERVYQGAWLIGFLLFGLLAANLVYPRFFCRVLCPLGALLGVLARWSWWRIQRDPQSCTQCDHCRVNCEGACDPQARLRKAECFVCFNCLEDCPTGGLRFASFAAPSGAVAGPDVSRRKLVFAGLSGLIFLPLVRASGRSTRDFSSRVIRPPGAVEELEFLRRCIKCGQCMRVCPTNVLQPDWFASGLEGLWTPVLNFRMGHCQLHCTACGEVCPTGAIERIGVARKLGQGEFGETGPVRLGTAHIDPARCLPHSKNVPCVVCEEVCPTSPKAIYGQTVTRPSRDGRPIELRLPQVDLEHCIGCGLCEWSCPVVGDRRAVYVTAEGETRSADQPQPDRNRSVRLARARLLGLPKS